MIIGRYHSFVKSNLMKRSSKMICKVPVKTMEMPYAQITSYPCRSR